jgi:hypothetical protein
MSFRPWPDEKLAAFADACAGGLPDADLGARFGISKNAAAIRRRRVLCPIDGNTPRFGACPYGPKGAWWSRERIIASLQDFARRNRGPLPTSDHVYSQAKKGHMEWPRASLVLREFGSMADAWAAIGAAKHRYNRGWVAWTDEDDDYLLSHAGEQTLKVIAKHIGRSWGACKRRLYDLEAGRARDVTGWLSAMQVAKEYNCPLSRVTRLIASGQLPAHRVVGGHYWRIDPMDAERLAPVLRAPKRTYKKGPPEMGDYDRRHGYRRQQGKRVPVTPEAQARERAKEDRMRIKAAQRLAVQKLEAAGLVIDVRGAA